MNGYLQDFERIELKTLLLIIVIFLALFFSLVFLFLTSEKSDKVSRETIKIIQEKWSNLKGCKIVNDLEFLCKFVNPQNKTQSAFVFIKCFVIEDEVNRTTKFLGVINGTESYFTFIEFGDTVKCYSNFLENVAVIKK